MVPVLETESVADVPVLGQTCTLEESVFWEKVVERLALVFQVWESHIVQELKDYGLEVLLHDPRASASDLQRMHGAELCSLDEMLGLGALIVAVPHREYLEWPEEEYLARLTPGGCLIDVKSVLNREVVEQAGVRYWRL